MLEHFPFELSGRRGLLVTGALNNMIFALLQPCPTTLILRAQMMMSMEEMESKVGKAMGVAAICFALAGSMLVLADGAASMSTASRAKNGARSYSWVEASANKGDFAAFTDEKVAYGSGSNRWYYFLLQAKHLLCMWLR